MSWFWPLCPSWLYLPLVRLAMAPALVVSYDHSPCIRLVYTLSIFFHLFFCLTCPRLLKWSRNQILHPIRFFRLHLCFHYFSPSSLACRVAASQAYSKIAATCLDRELVKMSVICRSVGTYRRSTSPETTSMCFVRAFKTGFFASWMLLRLSQYIIIGLDTSIYRSLNSRLTHMASHVATSTPL